MSAVCKGTNCTAINGIGHSPECEAEHTAIVEAAALADHIAHGGWKCDFCGYDGQDNQRGNVFCANCRRHK